MAITRKRRHEAMLEQGMHSGNTDAKFDPPPKPISKTVTVRGVKYWRSARELAVAEVRRLKRIKPRTHSRRNERG